MPGLQSSNEPVSLLSRHPPERTVVPGWDGDEVLQLDTSKNPLAVAASG